MYKEYICKDIIWDTDKDDKITLPAAVVVPRLFLEGNGYIDAGDDDETAKDTLADALSDTYGFCVFGCEMETRQSMRKVNSVYALGTVVTPVLELGSQESRKVIAVEILKELNYLPSYIRAFRDKGDVFCSEEPYGFAYELNDEQKQYIADMEEQGKRIVYAVIHGVYKDACEDKSDVTTYLYVSDDEVRIAIQNIRDGNDLLSGILDDLPEPYCGKRAWAFVHGWDDDIGTVGVHGIAGGLTRTV